MKSSIFFAFVFCFAAVCSAQPAAFWASSPVSFGETALVYGGNFTSDAVAVVESTPFGETCEVKPVYASETCVMFPWPEEIGDGEALVSIRTPEGETKPLEVNQLQIWWIQGDQGRTATAKTGWIRLVSPDDSLRLVNVQLRLASDPKAPEIKLPETSPSKGIPLSDVKQSGDYTVLVGGRPVGTIAIRSEKEQNFIHDGTFRLTDFGAIPNDGIDDTPAFLAAVEALRSNGGGTLLIPSGRFQMNETLELPPHSALVGEADILSLWDPWESGNLCGAQIYWPDRSEPLECLVHGTHDFAVESITLTCGNHRDGISNQLTPEQKAAQEAGQKIEPQKNVRIRNVTLRMIYSEYANAAMDETVRRLNPIHYARALRLCGENVQVWRNDVYCQAGGVFEIKCRWSSFTENRFSRGNIVGWNGFGGQQIIFAENHLGGANCTSFYGLPEGSENILWQKNVHEQNFDGNNRETITGDLRIHGYIDRVESITPTGFNLLKEIQAERGGGTLQGEKVLDRGISTWYKPENEPQLNGMVQLAAGTGAGQMRRIREIKTLEDGTIHVEVDRPWEILPDEETVVVIASFRRHFICRENKFNDSTVAFQCYGSLLESVIQENHSTRTGGINADSMSGEPSWFNQYLENQINGSGVFRGPRNEVPATNAQFGVLSYGNGAKSYQYPMLRGCVVRRNCLIHNTKLNVMGPVCEAIIENNSIINSPIGITVDPAARGIFLRENEMDEVQRPYDFAPESVVSDPVEIFRANVLAVSERPDGTLPETISEMLPETISPDSLDSLRARVIREFAALCAKEKRVVTPLEAELLTGVKLDFPNWQTTWHVLQNGEAGTNPLYIQVRNPLVAATLQMRVKPEDFPLEGWTFELPEFRLEPGKAVAENMKITKPEGFGALVPIPITCTLTAADGSWTLEFTTRAINPWAEATPKDWLVSAPMENPNPTKHPAGIGYVKYENLPKVPADQLTEQTAQDKKLTLIPSEADPTAQAAADGQVVYAVTTITAKNPARIGLKNWAQGALVFVNGRLIGTNQQRGQWGFAELNEGENRIECWIYVSKRNQFQFKVPSVTWASGPF
ncbi:MAG: hypothetical protein Q4A17_06415 [Thermoguttaceae bacterium]|nr:hypothetical protein [Thermoguttaceae bacterium]